MDPKSWLGELRWQGYPKLGAVEPAPAAPQPAAAVDRERLEQLEGENERLKAKLDALSKAAREFERRLSEASTAYETALQDAEGRLRQAELEGERLLGELDALKAERSAAAARDSGREAELKLERERKAELERELAEARRRLEAVMDQDLQNLRREMREFLGRFGGGAGREPGA